MTLYWNERSGVECSYRGRWTNTVRCFLVHHFSSQTIISTWALKGLNQYNKTAVWQNFRNSHSLKSGTLWYSSNWKNLEKVRDSRIHAKEIWHEHVGTGSQRGKILWVSWPSVSKKEIFKKVHEWWRGNLRGIAGCNAEYHEISVWKRNKCLCRLLQSPELLPNLKL